MKTWKLGFDGYVMQYMISGPAVTPYESDLRLRDQLETEAALRKEISSEKPDELKDYLCKNGGDAPEKISEGNEGSGEIKAGFISVTGQPWKVYAPHNNCFIDVSRFYSTLQKIRFDVATDLLAEEDMDVKARVWSYMSVAVYVRGVKEGEIKYPVYKPMECVDVILPLKKGSNRIYFICENLGARDTRNILGMQILDSEEIKEKIRVSLPDRNIQDSVYEAEEYLSQITLRGEEIILPKAADDRVGLHIINRSPDYYRDRTSYEIPSLGKTSIEVAKNISTVRITLEREQFTLSRVMEFAGHMTKLKNDDAFLQDKEAVEKNRLRMFSDIGKIKSLDRGEFGFGIMNVLARQYIKEHGSGIAHESSGLSDEDRQLLSDDLASIEKRVDCADFLVCGFIRYIHNYKMDSAMEARLKEVLLGFRYWMNEEGSDAMCFWSENHSLMFYSSAMFAGEMYKDEYFSRAKMTGRELYSYGRKKVIDWIEDVEKYGFEEFLSNVYMNVTLAALLNLIDYGDEEISARITGICDELIRSLCLQCFRGTLIAPMGRVYREILYPFMGNTQALINAIDPSAPYCFGEGWMAYLATTKYTFPEYCRALMKSDCEEEYTSGNACIRLRKTQDYMLTSVQSPRCDGWKRWPNIRLSAEAEEKSESKQPHNPSPVAETGSKQPHNPSPVAETGSEQPHIPSPAAGSGLKIPEDTAPVVSEEQSKADPDSHEYNKSLNESFHGTSLFTPGTHGYQQHMWMAALDEEAVLFVNHPGTSSEFSDMRPGYWNGNGVMPAVLQKGRELLAVYSIPEKDPIHFIHMYCPIEKYDEVRFCPEDKHEGKGEWIFLRKGNGYMAFWTGEKPEPWSEKIFNCEYRMYSRDTGCYVKMGSLSEDGSFDEFCKEALSCEPEFDRETRTLKTGSGLSLRFEEGHDRTQYID
ncbi:MAG: hypothetical protein E7232_13855 [Lachnospiraceae bacterium]|nr:hypothetical protein [Lachnospiraceae bacterium]